MISKKFIPLLVLPLLLIPAYAQESSEIPVWVKGVANFWVEGNITDDEFAESITFLIEQGIIQIDSTPTQPTQSLSDESERLYKLEIAQKDEKISDLEKELEDIGLDNSKLLVSVVERDDALVIIQDELDNAREDFKKYKDDYPIKIGNIGGKLVTDYIKELEDKIEELEN